MDFSSVATTLEKMEQTSSRIALTDYLVQLVKNTPAHILDKVIYLIQGKIGPDYEGAEMGIAEKMIIRSISNATGVTVERIYEMYRKSGDLGDVANIIMEKKMQKTLFSEIMTVERIYLTFDKIAKTVGKGSQEAKSLLLSSLFNDSNPNECRYITKFALGTLRLGVADNSILDALAIAFTEDKEKRNVLESAYNVSGDLGKVGRLLATEGLATVASLKIKLFIPIRPMLAERVSTADEALDKMNGRAAAEFKLDGERVQIHKGEDKVAIFSRRLENITSYYPDVVNSIRRINPEKVIFEAEVVAIEENTGELLPFQELMHRRRKYNISEVVKKYPISLNLFDVLYLDGESKTNLPYTKRRSILESSVSKTIDPMLKIIPQKIVRRPIEIEERMSKAIEAGCEGLMLKQLGSSYRAGAREFAWIKIKREYRSEIADTIDLVVVGAMYGRGRRTGKYGALLLAAYDKDSNLFKSVCKVGSGFKDKDLELLWNEIEPYVIPRRHQRVRSTFETDTWIEPKIVIEIIASEITLSPSYDIGMDAIRTGFGLSLRFPKFTGKIRFDKNPEDATSESELISLYKQQLRTIKS